MNKKTIMAALALTTMTIVGCGDPNSANDLQSKITIKNTSGANLEDVFEGLPLKHLKVCFAGSDVKLNSHDLPRYLHFFAPSEADCLVIGPLGQGWSRFTSEIDIFARGIVDNRAVSVQMGSSTSGYYNAQNAVSVTVTQVGR